MRNLYALMVLLLLADMAAAAAFTAEMDVDTYVDAREANQSFSENDTLWAASEGGEPTKEVYLSFVNLFGSQGIYRPEDIESATLTLDTAEIEDAGEIKAYLVHGATFDTATWNDKPEYESDVSASVEVDREGSCTIDVTPLIKKAVEICTEGCPYSIALVAENDASVGFVSSEASAESSASLVYVTGE